MKLIFFIAIFGLLVTGCGVKPVACLSSNPTASVGQRIGVSSCSIDVDAYQWTVEGGGETIIAGGGYCDKAIEVSFSTAGEKTIRLIAWKFKKKSKATCDSGLNSGKTDETTYKITVQ